jgi:hypothetical protein
MIETIRDIFIIIYLGMGIVLSLIVLIAVLFIAKAFLGLVRSIKRTLGNVEELATTVRDKVGKPLASGSSISYIVGTVLGFLTGFRRRGKR